MKNVALLCLILLCACSGQKTTAVVLPDGSSVKAEIADTQEETEKGLMFRKDLKEGHGMLFVFEEDEPRLFWMKNTLIDLDIIFITSSKEIFSVAHNVPHSYVYTPDDEVATAYGYGKYVLELPAGQAAKHSISAGAKIDFNLN